MVAQDKKGNPLWRCSGTLLSPTLFLTAGHCTEAPAAQVEIWFDSGVESGIPENGYPNDGDVGGTPYTHPQYNPNAFYLYDLGVVVLKQPYRTSTYGKLPQLDVLDRLATQRGTQNVTFTAAGTASKRCSRMPRLGRRTTSASAWFPIRTWCRSTAGPVGDFFLLLSNNTSSGGTCFGDSGGPNFIGDSNVVGGVTSFGLNGNCSGTGGVYRVDRADDLDWIQGEFADELR